MKTIVVLISLFCAVLAQQALEKSIIDTALEKIIAGIDAVVGPDLTVKESNVTFWFFSKEDPNNGLSVTKDSVSELSGTSFNKTKDTMFLVHGWGNTNTSDFITTVKKAVTTNLDVNFFVYDWSQIAEASYIPARNAVPEVAKFLAKFIQSLISTYDLLLSKTTLVGHSLGGHVVGIAGAALNGSVATIVGLDPALPLFLDTPDNGRLDATDAQYVQVIHTNGDFKGLSTSLGHSDYYPNGGEVQPGCGSDLDGSCAHARAYELYAESLGSNGFLAVSCGSYDDFTNGKCKNGSTFVMGTYHIDKSVAKYPIKASGKYYLNTNSESPYAKG